MRSSVSTRSCGVSEALPGFFCLAGWEEDEVEELQTRRVRAAKNQSLFREVNEQLERLAERPGSMRPQRFVCECLYSDCIETIQLELDDYERVRARPSWFFVVPGHEDPTVENVVEKGLRYTVVEKIGVGAVIAGEQHRRT
jgi:hypothetical protein